jgi:hypothetical protein
VRPSLLLLHRRLPQTTASAEETASLPDLPHTECSVLAVPVYLTGEPAEHLVEHLPGVTKPAIEQHEESAEAAFIAVLVLGIAVLGALGFFRGPRPIPHWFGVVSLVIALATCGLMLRTANLGGKVRHTEIRNIPEVNASIRAGH